MIGWYRINIFSVTKKYRRLITMKNSTLSIIVAIIVIVFLIGIILHSNMKNENFGGGHGGGGHGGGGHGGGRGGRGGWGRGGRGWGRRGSWGWAGTGGWGYPYYGWDYPQVIAVDSSSGYDDCMRDAVNRFERCKNQNRNEQFCKDQLATDTNRCQN